MTAMMCIRYTAFHVCSPYNIAYRTYLVYSIYTYTYPPTYQVPPFAYLYLLRVPCTYGTYDLYNIVKYRWISNFRIMRHHARPSI